MAYELTLKNCKLFNLTDNNQLVDIVIRENIISRIGSSSVNIKYRNILDTEGRLVIPGIIDIHIQGAGGADILDGTVESLQTMAKTLAKLGTTGFLATTVVKPENKNLHLKEVVTCIGKDMGGASLLGIHLEGPFINTKKIGGISPYYISHPSQKILDKILHITGDTLRIMTIAPELPGCHDIIQSLVNTHVIASFGHSDATYEETKKGFEKGISHVTHICNAMPQLHHRVPGPLPAIFETSGITVQIISDGVHLHSSIVNMIYNCIGEMRCICITDGVRATGLPEGRYVYNGREYESKNGSARYSDGTLIGSTVSLVTIALRFMEFTGCTLETAINTVTKNPAELLGIFDKKGSIDMGKDADIVVLDNDYSVWATIINGKICYKK